MAKSYEKRQIWTKGRNDCAACVTVFIYKNGAVIAASEPERTTEHQMHKVLAEEFPGVEFSVSPERGDGLYMEAR